MLALALVLVQALALVMDPAQTAQMVMAAIRVCVVMGCQATQPIFHTIGKLMEPCACGGPRINFGG
jgi:hypothetical protein